MKQKTVEDRRPACGRCEPKDCRGPQTDLHAVPVHTVIAAARHGEASRVFKMRVISKQGVGVDVAGDGDDEQIADDDEEEDGGEYVDFHVQIVSLMAKGWIGWCRAIAAVNVLFCKFLPPKLLREAQVQQGCKGCF